jgi:uncharacterized protein
MNIFEAVQNGDRDALDSLLRGDPEAVNETDSAGLRPVEIAMYYGQREIAAQLRAAMDSVNIWEAAALGELETVQVLAQADPKAVNAVAPDGFTPLGLAAFFGWAEVLGWLVDQGANPNVHSENQMSVYPINSAAANRNEETALKLVRVLVEHGADVNVAQHGGWTPLHQAAAHDLRRLTRFLLDHGADRSVKSEDGRTAEDMARAGGFEALAEEIAAG